ncbi:MAG: FHA domain-containing protein [Clostridium sp.]|nr:FHA domain-containing protein [Clostridium sp.]MCM1171265.1 FHA domain-containing protein [Clostridium sp.]MCM1207465.1 FHA domain-containing protein [Ruminococcus sp.]
MKSKKYIRLIIILMLILLVAINPINAIWANETMPPSEEVTSIETTTEKPATMEQSATTEKPTTTEQSATTEKPTTAEQPATTEKPTTTEQPATTEKPATTEQPATTEKPTTTEQSATTEKPTTTEQPATTKIETTTEIPALEPSTASNNNGTGGSITITEETVETEPREDYTVKEKPYDDKNRIEQVQIIKPKVRAYLYIEDLGAIIDENCICGSLGGSELATDSVKSWNQSGMGINYYIIIDVSAAMDEDYFEEIKGQIEAFGKKYMNQNDTLTVYTVGNDDYADAPIIKGLTKNDSDEISEKLNDIEISDNHSDLSYAIKNIAYDIHHERMLREEEFLDNRDIVIAFSGGEDVFGEEATSEEACEALKAEGITLFCFIQKDEASDGDAEELSKLSSLTGGAGYEVEKEQLASQVNLLINNLQNVYVVDFIAADNISDNSYSFLSVSIYMDEKEEIWEYAPRDVMISRYIKDDEPPVVESILLTEAGCIEVTYSESVLGADEVSSYTLVDESERQIPIASVEYKKNNSYSLKPAEGEIIYKGKYKLHINNVTDNTVEKNLLEKTEYDFEPENAPEYQEKKNGFLSRFWWLILIAVALIIIMAAVLVIIAVRKKKAKNNLRKLAEPAELVEEIKYETATNDTGRKLTLIVNSSNLKNKQIDIRINGSIIVGRSDLCDVFLADECLSRQHFAIEFDGDSFFVQDLDTTNGTMLNGVKLSHKRRIEKNDKITVGSLNIVVRW